MTIGILLFSIIIILGEFIYILQLLALLDKREREIIKLLNENTKLIKAS